MKPGVFTQLYAHLVFAPKYGERLLKNEIRPEVFSYISGIITNRVRVHSTPLYCKNIFNAETAKSAEIRRELFYLFF